MIDYAQFDFAVALLKETAKQERSMIASPISISTALFMVYLAARDESKEELRKVLGKSNLNWKLRLKIKKVYIEFIKLKN